MITRGSLSKFSRKYHVHSLDTDEYTGPMYYINSNEVVYIPNGKVELGNVTASVYYVFNRKLRTYTRKSNLNDYKTNQNYKISSELPGHLQAFNELWVDDFDPVEAYYRNARAIGENPKDYSVKDSILELVTLFSQFPQTVYQVDQYERDNKESLGDAYKLGFKLGYDNFPDSRSKIYEDNVHLIDLSPEFYGRKTQFLTGINNGRIKAISDKNV